MRLRTAVWLAWIRGLTGLLRACTWILDWRRPDPTARLSWWRRAIVAGLVRATSLWARIGMPEIR